MNRERVRRSGALAAFAAAALIVLAGCGSTADEEALMHVTRVPVMSDAAAQATREAESGATPGAGGEAAAAAMEVTIESHDIAFEPTEVTIPANTDVKFILPNLGASAHDFSIDALDIQEDIAPGATKEVVINAPAGEYEFYCNVPGHKEAGMVGTLIVSEDAAAPPAGATPAAGATPVAEAPAASPAAQAEQPAESAAAPAAPAAVEVVSNDIYFEPTEITIPANTDVTFTLPNHGVTAHDFSIDELGIQVDIAPGATEEIVVNAPAGTYEFYCNVPGHKAAGMVGTLTVTEDAAAAAPAAAEQEAASPAAAPEAASPAADAGAATPAEATPAPETADAGAAAADAVEVVSHDIYFDPKELTIPADTDVTFSLPNEGVTMHDFSIDELGIQVDLPPGETQEITINAPAGTYEYYCNVPGHKAAGMLGTLTVE